MSGDTLAQSDTLVNAKWQSKQGYFFQGEEEERKVDHCLRSRGRRSRHRVCGLNGPRGNPLYARAIKNDLA